MAKQTFHLAIIGRPNVGKSTLFNRLAGRRMALVHDQPGVTRDRRAAPGTLLGMPIEIIDTAGLEEIFDEGLEARMRQQTEAALRSAHCALMMIDARAGVTPLDRHFGAWLRRLNVPAVLVANKCEGRAGQAGLIEAYEIGLGEPVPISAEHGEGMSDLFDALRPWHDQAVDAGRLKPADDGSETEDDEGGQQDDRPIKLVIVGRPNVGKSTLLNALVGEDRVLTGPEAGITRDAITVDWRLRDRAIQLVDTAGLRRKARVDGDLEKLAAVDGINALKFAHVAILLLDAAKAFEKQDLTIARMVLDEGRALVVGVNKWDTVDDPPSVLKGIRGALERSLAQARGVPVVTCSALNTRGLDRLLDAALSADRVWNTRIPTNKLNLWLREMIEIHPPPLVRGRRIKIRYMTQVKARPPTFALWANQPYELPESYERYLVGGLRQTFNMPGVPIRLNWRKGKNPYATNPG
jgi:GTP-binding protein